MSDTKFTVSMHPSLVDELDEGFSPMDGIVAIDEMFSELPLLHPGLAAKRRRKRLAQMLKIYHGCYDWYKELGFSYVQIGTILHVLDLWYDKNPDLSQMNVILGTGKTEGYKPFGEDTSDLQADAKPAEFDSTPSSAGDDEITF